MVGQTKAGCGETYGGEQWEEPYVVGVAAGVPYFLKEYGFFFVFSSEKKGVQQVYDFKASRGVKLSRFIQASPQN